MKKLVPLRGYVLVRFGTPGGLSLHPDSYIGEKDAVVVFHGPVPDEDKKVGYKPDFFVGDRIYFTGITGKLMEREDGVYAFINYANIIGKEVSQND